MPTCKNCSNDFVSRRADAEFCKDACRKAFKRRGDIADNDPTSADKVVGVISADTVIADSTEMLSQASKLVAAQREHRGWTTNANGERILGRYIPSPESEARASQILSLRRQAMKDPTPLRPSDPTEVAQLAKEKGVSVVVARLLIEQRKTKKPQEAPVG